MAFRPAFSSETQAFLARSLRVHYEKSRFKLSQPSRREWMRQELGGWIRRPIYYESAQAACDAAAREPPYGVYASVATLTGTASAVRLESEVDVVLDVDCKTGAPPDGDGFADLADAFLAARCHVQATLETLRCDFRVEDEEVQLRFSGGKGYHLLLASERWRGLDRHGRAELLACLTGTGARLNLLLPRDSGRRPHSRPEGGAVTRVWEGLERLHTACRRPVTSSRLRVLLEHHAGQFGPEQVLEELRAASRIASVVEAHPDWLEVLAACAHHWAGPLLDGAVTQDLRRLLRVPGSINGKTGLLCRTLRLEELEDFDPFTDANPFPRTGCIRVKGQRAATLVVSGASFAIQSGECLEVPFCAAVPWVLQGVAEPVE